MSWFKLWPKAKDESRLILCSDSVDEERSKLESILAHSNFKEALPALSSRVLVDRHKNLIEDLYDATGFDREAFDSLILPLVYRFADYAQLLPASEVHHHHSVGGLLEHSLEVCLIATRRAKGISFCGHKQGLERNLDKARWPISCAIAGLAHDLGKIAYDLIVRSPEGHSLWNAYDETLYEFAEREGGYRVWWRSKRIHKLHEMAGLTLFSDLISKDLKAWLNKGDGAILPVTLMAIAGQESPEYPRVYEVVHESDKESVKRNTAKAPVGEGAKADTVIGAVAMVENSALSSDGASEELAKIVNDDGSELEADPAIDNDNATTSTIRLMKLLPGLLSSRKWVVNERDRDRGLFWVDDNSAWATWPALYSAINRVFEEDGFASYPRVPGVFFDMLLSAGITTKSAGEYTADVQIVQESGKKLTLSMARILDKEIVDLLRRYAENQVELIPKTQLAESVNTRPSEFVASVSEASEAKETIEKIDLMSGLDGFLATAGAVENAKATLSNTEKQQLSEYVRSLNNPSIKWLREQDEAGEIVESICSVIAKGKLASKDYGVIDGSLWIEWQKIGAELGDDEEYLLSVLMEAGYLRQADNVEFSVIASGLARVTVKGRQLVVLVINKKITATMRKAYGFNSAFELNLPSVEQSAVLADETAIKSDLESQMKNGSNLEGSNSQTVENNVCVSAEDQQVVIGQELAITVPKTNTPASSKVEGAVSQSAIKVKESKPFKSSARPSFDFDASNPLIDKKKNNVPSKLQQKAKPSEVVEKDKSEIAAKIAAKRPAGITGIAEIKKPQQTKAVPNKKKKDSSNPSLTEKNAAKPRNDHSTKKPQTVVTESSEHSAEEIFNVLDSFLASNFQEKKMYIFEHSKGVAFWYISIAYRDACEAIGSLKEQWLARLIAAKGVTTDDIADKSSNMVTVHIVPNRFLKKTAKLLKQEQLNEG